MTVSLADDDPRVNLPIELDVVLDSLRLQFDWPDLALDGPPNRLSGGFWAEMWTLALQSTAQPHVPRRVVVRLAPDRSLAAWEIAFQAGVAAQGYPTPAILASDTHTVGDHRAWCVMEHAAGRPLLAGLSGVGALRALPRLATALPDTLARAAAALHTLDSEPINATLAQIPGRSVGIDGLLEHYLTRADELANAPLRRSVERLAGTRPADALRVVCHGDLHPFNVLATGDQYVVLDWTAGQIAHPAYDLAFTLLLLGNPPLAAPRPLRPVVGAAARRIARRFLATYRRLSPHPIEPETLDWYRDLHACRVMTDLAGWRATGTVDMHRGHPWFAIEPALTPLLAD